MGEIISDCTPFDPGDSSTLSCRIGVYLFGEEGETSCEYVETYMTRLRVLRGNMDTPHLNPELGRGSTTSGLFKVDAMGRSWHDEETALSRPLLPPGSNRELSPPY